MEQSYRITLPADVWEDFSHRMSHPERDGSKGVAAFFRNVGVDVHVRHDGQMGFLASEDLDTAGILAALSSGCVTGEKKENLPCGYQMRIASTIYVASHGYGKTFNAEENCYRVCLCDRLFYSMDTRNQLKTA